MVQNIRVIKIKTSIKEEIVDITSKIQKLVIDSNVKSGICIIYSPHTTAGITINENYDPDVKDDILLSLNNIVKELNFKHSEGNSSSHIKTSLIGKTQNLIIENGELLLGTWDGIYFCEFDGARDRKIFVKIIEG